MSDDIEAFLRQAAQRRAARKRPARQRASDPIVEAEAIPEPPPHAGRSAPPVQASGQAATEAAMHDESLIDESLGDMSWGVATEGEPIAFDEPPQFEHISLDEPSPQKGTSQWAAILGDPANVRQALILGEILRRPFQQR